MSEKSPAATASAISFISEKCPLDNKSVPRQVLLCSSISSSELLALTIVKEQEPVAPLPSYAVPVIVYRPNPAESVV